MPEQSVTGFWIHIDWRMAMIGAFIAQTPWLLMMIAQFINMIVTHHKMRVLRKAIRQRRVNASN